MQGAVAAVYVARFIWGRREADHRRDRVTSI